MADFVVDFSLGAQDRVQIHTSLPPYEGRWWSLEDWWAHPASSYVLDVRQYREGTLVIDIFDAHSHARVWHGSGTPCILFSNASRPIKSPPCSVIFFMSRAFHARQSRLQWSPYDAALRHRGLPTLMSRCREAMSGDVRRYRAL
jgi:hypothetical protein